MNTPVTLKMMVLVLITLISTTSTAEVFCATSSPELVTALSTAATNNESDIIRIQKGTYITPVGGFEYDTSQEDNISIEGGWLNFQSNPCGLLVLSSPGETYLDGNSENRTMFINVGVGDTIIKISGISFINGGGETSTSGLLLTTGQLSPNAEVHLENNAFINNTAELRAGLALRSTAGKIVVRNNLFTQNHSTSTINTTFETVFINTPGFADQGLYFTNNTVFNNVSGGTYIVQQQALSIALIANNIFWNNGMMDLRFNGNGYKFLHHNNIGIQTGVAANEQFGNLSELPFFENGPMNFTPSTFSPLVGAGIRPPLGAPTPVPFEDDWSIGDRDLEGNQRWQGNQIDIGAIESPHSMQQEEPPIFKNGFEAPLK